MNASDIAIAVLRAERMGHEKVTLVTWRAKEPHQTVTLLHGVPAFVVGTERVDGRVKVIAQARVADLRRWYERTGAKLPDDMPDEALGIRRPGGAA